MDPTLIGSFAIAGATLVAAGVAAWSSMKSNRRIRTNHGKTIGQHVEEAALSAHEAKIAAQLVALNLAEYEKKQEVVHQGFTDQLNDHTRMDNEFQQAAERFWAPLVPLLTNLTTREKP